MAVDFTRVTDACLIAFGGSFTFTRVTPPGVSQTITGCVVPGIEPEDSAPGDASTYFGLLIATDALSPAPIEGDEVSTATTIYKIFRLDKDEAGGLLLYLRKDRAVP